MITTDACTITAIDGTTVSVTWHYSDDTTFSTDYQDAPTSGREVLVDWLRQQVRGPNGEEKSIVFTFAEGL